MQLTEHRLEDRFYVHSLGDRAIRIVDTDYSESILLTPDRGVTPWPVESVTGLDLQALAPVLAYEPDIVLLASGRRLRFPDAKIQHELLRHNIGLEVMPLAAAARTFNVLASEERRVLGALIWEPGT